ncbi:nitrogenase [Geomonas subterranea]|uniref:Nitrogenase n=1 Tax=Geomonas subterranea TaxID=2847989 RepID=A0ABX8LL84_9BACT|nr:nitrogenase component 1 [Geomonas subterranea]QXE91394.1 nitrogenase [Geomonas subterranea]QXM10519.1 nitrogenase [Geomonas subterranea]
MAINTKIAQAPIRELRLDAITGYSGSVHDLAARTAPGCCLSNRERSFAQTSSCSSGCAQTLLSGIVDAAVVNHAPLGCLGDSLYQNIGYHYGQFHRNWPYSNVSMISTNMGESDTVFGGAERLKDGIREAWRRFKPKAIFVTTSCASGIIGDDVQGVIDELKDEIPTPVVPVHCEGFRSRVWATGFDAAFHAILTRIVKPPEQKSKELVNIINFRGSARAYITDLFARVGLKPVFVVPFATVGELERISEAAASLTICGTLGSYLGTALEEEYGVPYVKSTPPHGFAGMDAWLRGLGQAVGKEREIEALIVEEKRAVQDDLAQVRQKLAGATAVIGMGPGFSLSYIRVLEELGIKVLYAASWHYDQHYDHGSQPAITTELATEHQDIPFGIGEQQNFEIANLLKELKPDLYFSRHPGSSVWAAKQGIVTIPVMDEYTAFGYRGLVNFGWRIADALANRRFVNNLAQRVRLPYQQWWFEQNPYHFLSQEEAA